VVPELAPAAAIAAGGLNAMDADFTRQRQIAEAERVAEERRRQAVLERQRDEDAKADAALALSDATVHWRSEILRRKESATGGAQDFTGQLLKDFDQWTGERAAEGFATSPAAARYVRQHLTALRTQLAEQALAFEAGARVGHRIDSMIAAQDTAAKGIATDPAAFPMLYQQQVGLIDAMDVPPAQKAALKERLQKTFGAAAMAGAQSAAEAYQREAITNPVGAIAAMNAILDGEGPSLMGPEKVRAAKQKFAEQAWSSHFTRRLTTSRNDPRALGALERDIDANEALDPDRKSMLIGRATQLIDEHKRRAEATYDRHLRTVERGIAAVNASTLAGYEPTAEQMAPLITAAKGTELEPQVRQMVAVANATGEFRRMAPAAQEGYLAQMEAAARKDPTKFDVTMVDRFRTIHENQRRALRDSPITFAVRQGLVEPTDPAAQPLDLSKPETLGPQLQARFGLARTMQARGGEFKPLTPEEVSVLGQSLRQAPVQAKRDFFAKLSTASGSDMAGYQAVMAQLAPDDPVTAIAGAHAGRGRAQAADAILRGQAILNPPKREDGSPSGGKLWPMPPEREMREAFAAVERDAFAGMPKARSDLYQAASAIYAAKAAEEGDSTGQLNSRRWEESIRLATGGIERYRGHSVVLPYGQDLGQFRDGLRARINALATSGRLAPEVTREKLLDMPAMAVGDGRYALRAGDGVLVDKAGQPVILDFNASAPAPASLPAPGAEFGETGGGAAAGLSRPRARAQ